MIEPSGTGETGVTADAGGTRWTGDVRGFLVGAALIVVAAILTHASALTNGFVLDDTELLARGPAVRGLGSALGAFTEAVHGGQNSSFYRPVVFFSYAIDRALFGDGPRGFHAVDLGLHAANGVLVFGVLARFARRRIDALLAALLFVVHPLQVESVELITYRTTLLSTFFLLAAVHVYLEVRTRGARPASVAAIALLFAASIGSKETGIVLPAVFLLVDRLVPTDRPPPRSVYLACGATLLIYLTVRAAVIEPPTRFYFEGASVARIVLAVTVVQAYAFSLVFLPRSLAPTYGADVIPEPSGPADPLFVLCALGLLGLAAIAVAARHRRPLITLGLCVYALGLAPTLHIAPMPVLFGERFLYLPLVGIGLCLVDVVGRIESRPVALGTRIALLGACLVLANASLARGPTFHDEASIWRSIVAARPRSVQAHVGLATVLERADRCEEALPSFAFALSRLDGSPRDRPVFGLAASCLSRSGHDDAALGVVERWLSRHPDDAGFRSMRTLLVRSLRRPPGPLR